MSGSGSSTQGGYTFFPYVRRGLATSIATLQASDNSVQARANLSVGVTVQATLNSTGPQSISATGTAQLYGPGDVLALNPGHIIRTEPLNLTVNFEPNYLAGIEFDQPDLPWVFTPAAAAVKPVGSKAPPGVKQLLPWTVLIVLKDEEFQNVQPPPGPLPAISVQPGAQLPSLSESWAWAHVQATGASVGSSSDLQTLMSTSPTSVISRILCPRMLEADTHYTAFLVPAFQAGVATGLGTSANATSGGGSSSSSPTTTTWAWTGNPTTALQLPYYYTFEFATSDAGDFQSLVNQIKPRSLPSTVGIRPYVVDDPGWGLIGAGAPMNLWGALISFEPQTGSGSTGPPPNSNGQLIGIDDTGKYTGADWVDPPIILNNPATPQADKTNFQQQLSGLLNYSTLPPDNPSDPDPQDVIVAPPLYARWHAMVNTVSPSSTSWVSQLNLDPRTRSIAGLGVQIVQIERNQLMASAWAQLAGVKAANQVLRQMQLARGVLNKVLAKNLTNVTSSSLLALTSNVLSRIASGGASSPTVYSVLAGSQLPILTLSGPFRQAFRPLGPIRQRQSGVTFAPATTNTGSLSITVAGVPSTTSVQVSVTGPGGYTASPKIAGGATSSLTNLTPGTYTIQGGAATGYQTTQASYPASVTAGQTATVTVTYQPTGTTTATGSLSITVAGLPVTLSVQVAITGPGGYNTVVAVSATAPYTLKGLAPGTYTIVGKPSAAGYQPTQGSSVANVTANSTTSVTVTYQSSGGTTITTTAAASAATGGMGAASTGITNAITGLSAGTLVVAPSGSTLTGLLSVDAISAQAQKAAGLSANDQKVLGQMVFKNLTPTFVKAIPPSPNFTLDEKTTTSPTVSTTTADSPAASSFRSAMEQLTSMFVAGTTATTTQPPQQPNLTTLSQTVTQGLNPSTNLAKRASALVTSSGGSGLSSDPLAEIMWAPSFPQPMYAPLAALSQDYLIPGLETMPDETMSLLQSNPVFIESYMVGLNDEMGRQLLWNGFPTDQRGTYFAQFWPPVNPSTSAPAAGSDIPAISQWPTTNSLGQNMEQGVADAENIVLLIRSGSLFMRYPNTTIYAVQGTAPPTGSTTPGLGTVETLPIFQGKLAPDVTFFGFNLTMNQVLSSGTTTNGTSNSGQKVLAVNSTNTFAIGMTVTINPGGTDAETATIASIQAGASLTMVGNLAKTHSNGELVQVQVNPNWGYYFVFQQHPTEPRFGFEPAPTPFSVPAASTWSQVTWANLAGSASELSSMQFASVNQSMQSVNLTGPPDTNDHWGDPDAKGNYSDSAQVAYITFRLPVRIAIHADTMLQGLG